MNKRTSTFWLVLTFFVGLCLLLYPTFSNHWNLLHQSHAIAVYNEEVRALPKTDCSGLIQDAADYNADIPGRARYFKMSDAELERYASLLNPDGSGVMGHIEIPLIDVDMPIYHGVGEDVLQVAAGHVEWSSLPVGGPDTHCVLSGHRGLPSADLFTHLDRLQKGDLFILHILGNALTYEVDQIRIVEPDELEELLIRPGMDLCTLVTCTPYGINSHRLLVRGHRIQAEEPHPAIVPADALQVDTRLAALAIAAPILLILLIAVLFFSQKA